MRIAHEAPLSIMNRVQNYTDYDYALVHLFEESEEYFNFFIDALAKGRHVILDNSIFELGEAFDTEKYSEWICRLMPSEYIIPDALEDMHKTIDNCEKWFENIQGEQLYGSIGVVQGKNLQELNECYAYMSERVDKIAISFDYSWYEEQYPVSKNKYHAWMRGRHKFLYDLEQSGRVNKDKPHHLLGCGLPQEFAVYQHIDWIDTIDTSNPVAHGMHGIRYQRQALFDIWGLDEKHPTKMCDMINDSVDNIADVFYNMEKFRHNISRGL